MLIIDDVENVGLSMKRLLSLHHEVQTMQRAREALEALTGGQRWDVILCDLTMPEMNGIDFVTAVRALDPSVLPRIILMSGGAYTPEADAFLRDWPHAHLEKPIPPQLLMDEVDRAVDHARRR